VLIALCTFGAALGGIYIALAFLRPFEGVMVLIGVGASMAFGVKVVAPVAGRKARKNIYNAIANPSPEEEEALQGLAVHMVGNLSKIAQHPEARKMLVPVFHAAWDGLEEGIGKSVANLQSQAAKGIGAFSEGNGGDWKQILSEVFLPTIDGFLDNFGASDAMKKKVHVKLLSGMTGGNQQTPSAPGGGGGWR